MMPIVYPKCFQNIEAQLRLLRIITEYTWGDLKMKRTNFHIRGPSYIKPLDKMKVAAGTINKKPEENKFDNETDYNETTTEKHFYNRTAFPRSSRRLLDFTEIQEINETFVPRNFNFPTRDITVVFTAGPFYKRIPVPYAQDYKTYEGLTCTASGYEGSDYIGWARVHWVKLKIISTAECSKLHSTNMKRFVCTLGHPEDLEEGEAGGPLVCKKTGHAGEGPLGILVGIICGKRIFREGVGKNETIKSSVFYTRVSTYTGFIANPSRNNKAIIMIVPDFTLWISAFIFSTRLSGDNLCSII
ncbi:chymotrypsin-like protease CTRL-1 isoform X2 [Choristoneura fumiferana]|uniref:chymotrypsin-like protease CTRL-1 isoform X2 n=1 Tax=Choristoneura fumiferana TaxID=7141 RepID=UPI003D15E02B